ncbi:MAG: carboxy terminal-processing peptidase, partial [Chlamydiia bacterium]|nr:carboxy terminal-processing peptidase [Chlamydiia bacterium]
MSFFRILLCLSIFMAAPGLQSSRLPEIGPKDVTAKVHEIMRAHVEHKKMTPLIMRRTVERFLAELDPSKTYFIRDDIADWLDLDDKKVDTLVAQFEESNFTAFQSLFDRMQTAIQRRDTFEKELATAELPKDVRAKEFKDLEWCISVEALRERLLRIRALQKEAV